MPRTIDSIMTSHAAAESRRIAVRPIWDSTILLKDLLDPDAGAAQVGIAIAQRIRTNVTVKERKLLECGGTWDPQLEEIVDSLATISGVGFESAQEELNEWLDALYDWADRNRFWIS